MAQIRLNRIKYNVLDDKCIGCTCLQLGQYQSRGATMSGSRNTGNYENCCMHRAYHGCPDDKGFSEELKAARIKAGHKTI